VKYLQREMDVKEIQENIKGEEMVSVKLTEAKKKGYDKIRVATKSPNIWVFKVG